MKRLFHLFLILIIPTACETAGDRFKSFDVKENMMGTIKDHSIRNICFLDENIGFVAISNDSIMRTLDGGKSFTLSLTDSGRMFGSIRFVNDSVGFVSGQSDRLYKTVNGGKKWQTIILENPNQSLTDLVCINKETILVSSASTLDTNKGSLYISSDGGLNWTTIPTPPFSQLFFINERIGFGCGINGILKSKDGGKTWMVISEQKANEIVFVDEEVGYAVYQRSICSTKDGGRSWKLLKTILNRTWVMGEDDSKIESLSVIDEKTIMFTLNARLIKVSSGGKEWSQYEFTRPYIQFQLLGKNSGIVYGYENLTLVNF